MTTGLDFLRRRLADYLTAGGVCAMTAWPEKGEKRPEGTVAAVSLRACQAEGSGLADYLGERWNGEAEAWEELYGRAVRLTFGLDLYCAPEKGEGELESVFLRLTQLLAQGGPEGLSVEAVSGGQTEYDQSGRLLKCRCEALCRAYLYAVADQDGGFLDFEIKGGMKQ